MVRAVCIPVWRRLRACVTAGRQPIAHAPLCVRLPYLLRIGPALTDLCVCADPAAARRSPGEESSDGAAAVRAKLSHLLPAAHRRRHPAAQCVTAIERGREREVGKKEREGDIERAAFFRPFYLASAARVTANQNNCRTYLAVSPPVRNHLELR